MGNQSSQSQLFEKEKKTESVDATLYYFAGRGRADQIRWILAATGVTFDQKIVSSRDYFVKLAEYQLPFRQLPMLQIDGQDLAQSQAICRYLARRANIAGTNSVEEVKIDMLAEAVNDLIPLAMSVPFIRKKSPEELDSHIRLARVKWQKLAARLEAILRKNGGVYLVGESLSYADVLVGHLTTWFVEEFGSETIQNMNLVVSHQCMVISLPGIAAFIKNNQLYYPLGDDAYVDQVNEVLGR